MPDGKIYWYVLFARTGAEERLAERLRVKLGEGYLPFVPQKTCVFRRQGKKSFFQKVCFPGYLFIESDKPAAEFMEYAFPIVYKQKEAYRFLCYGDKNDIAMRDEERIALNVVLGDERKIDISIGFKEGDSVRVISGVLEGNESKIVRINKSRHEAVLALQMFNNTVSVTVGLEFIEKMPEAPVNGGRMKKDETKLHIESLTPYPNHPFALYEGKHMKDMVESIREHGIISPIIVRLVDDGKYEILSGHNWVEAAKQLGLDEVPVIINEDLSDAEAALIVTDGEQSHTAVVCGFASFRVY